MTAYFLKGGTITAIVTARTAEGDGTAIKDLPDNGGYALKCKTCEQPHTVRIGVGSDSAQTHKFPCRYCNEEIVLRMDVDHEKRGWRVICEVDPENETVG